jgi:hypothetical protein
MRRPAQTSREVTPSSDKVESFDVATHYAQEGIKGDNKQRPSRTATTTGRDNGSG